MLRLAAEAQELMRVQVACDMATYVPRQGFQRSKDWTLLLLGHFFMTSSQRFLLSQSQPNSPKLLVPYTPLATLKQFSSRAWQHIEQ